MPNVDFIFQSLGSDYDRDDRASRATASAKSRERAGDHRSFQVLDKNKNKVIELLNLCVPPIQTFCEGSNKVFVVDTTNFALYRIIKPFFKIDESKIETEQSSYATELALYVKILSRMGYLFEDDVQNLHKEDKVQTSYNVLQKIVHLLEMPYAQHVLSKKWLEHYSNIMTSFDESQDTFKSLKHPISQIRKKIGEKLGDIELQNISESQFLQNIHKKHTEESLNELLKKYYIFTKDGGEYISKYPMPALHYLAMDPQYLYVIGSWRQAFPKVVIDAFSYTNDWGRTPLFFAIEHGNIQLVEYLIDPEINPRFLYGPDSRNNTPLCVAIKSRHLDVIKCLLKYKALDEKSLLLHEFALGTESSPDDNHYVDLEVLNIILQEFPTQMLLTDSSRKFNALMRGVEEGKEWFINNIPDELAAELINKGKGDWGQTVLHIAANSHDAKALGIVLQLMERLDDAIDKSVYIIKKGADPKDCRAKDSYGNSFLHYLARKNRYEDLDKYYEKFQEWGVISAMNDFQRTVGHFAALYGSEKFLEVLLKHNAIDVNQQDNYGRTTLHLASTPQTVTLLLSCGSNPDIQDAKSSKNVAHYYVDHGKYECLKSLLIGIKGNTILQKKLFIEQTDHNMQSIFDIALDYARDEKKFPILAYLYAHCEEGMRAHIEPIEAFNFKIPEFPKSKKPKDLSKVKLISNFLCVLIKHVAKNSFDLEEVLAFVKFLSQDAKYADLFKNVSSDTSALILATQHNIDSRIVDLLFDHKKASHKSLVSTALQYGNLHVIKKIIKVMTDNVEHLECYLDAKECNEISAYLNTLSDIRTVDAEIHKALRVFLQYAHKKQSKNFTLPECVQSIKYLRLEHLIDEWLKPILDKDMKDAKTKLSKHLPDCSELLLGQISKDMLKKGVIKVTEMLEFSDRTEHYTAALKEERQFFDALSRYVTGDNVCTACFAWNEKIYFVNNNSKFEVVRNRLQSLWNDSEDHVVISDLQEDYYYTMLTIDAVKKAFKAIDGYIKVLAQIEHNVHTAAKDTKVKLEEILKSQKDGNIIETKYHTIERFIDLYNRIETLNHLMPDKIEKLYQSFSKDFRVFIAVKQDRDFLVKNMVKYINMPHDFVEQGEQFPNVKIWATESVTEGFRCLTLGGASDKIHGNFIPDPKKIPHADVQMLDLIQHLIQKGDEALRVCKEEVYIAINMPTCFMCFNVYKAYNQVRETHITYCVPTERIWPSWVYPHIIEDAGVMKCMEQYLDEARALGESLEGFSNLL